MSYSIVRRVLGVVVLASLLLAGCESKKETCAKYGSGLIDYKEARRRLGVPTRTSFQLFNYCQQLQQ
ncbi:hypothetical protein [Synechococcus sp. LA31]|uniref:hypothetical protein n=1 Tax=Synechococcus sp. LA31 TaxID=2741953 RepID=UPI001BDD389F|nr:hypothetical protein [Synechococcus sp. LA31]QVV66772.1 hypothetical protein KJJ24_09775 [Synechococcus sp. LA31]